MRLSEFLVANYVLSAGESCDSLSIINNIYRVILIYCRVSVAYNFQTGKNKIKLHVEYESVTQNLNL
jgi:hypothetical protein